jgi:hypothetical protein
VADDKGVVPQVEETKIIDLTAAQAIFWGGDVYFGVKFGFTELSTVTPVEQERVNLENLFDDEAVAVAVACLLALGQA